MAAVNAQWSQTLVDSLVAGGMTHVVVSPGSRNTPLVLACDGHPGLETHVVLDERAAAFVALGMARTSDSPVGLLCTSGSAGAHYLPAIVEARYSRIPLIVMTADRPPELHYAGSPQTIDQHGFFGDHVRASFSLAAPTSEASPRWLASVAAQAVDAAVGSPAGPVHLNIPFREPLWDAQETGRVETSAPATIQRQAAEPAPTLVADLASALRTTNRGVIICGPNTSTVQSDDVADGIATLASVLGWPVLADPASGLRYGRHNRDGVVSAYDAFLRNESVGQSLQPECVLRFGQVPTSKPLQQWLARGTAQQTILVDPDGWWHDPQHRAQRLVVAEPGALCRALVGELDGESAQSAWTQRWRHADQAAWTAMEPRFDQSLWEGQVARTLLDTLPDGAALHVASSMPIRDLDGFTASAPRRIRVLANRGANGIDGTVATAAGESFVWRDGPLAVLMGDLALLHDVSGLMAAIGLGVRMTVVVVDNGGGGIFDHLPIAQHDAAFERYFLTPQKTDIPTLCQAAGARLTRVEERASLAPAIAADLEREGVGIVHVTIDRGINLETHRAAWAAVCDTLQPWNEETTP